MIILWEKNRLSIKRHFTNPKTIGLKESLFCFMLKKWFLHNICHDSWEVALPNFRP